jgi:hypothetical protein
VTVVCSRYAWGTPVAFTDLESIAEMFARYEGHSTVAERRAHFGLIYRTGRESQKGVSRSGRPRKAGPMQMTAPGRWVLETQTNGRVRRVFRRQK